MADLMTHFTQSLKYDMYSLTPKLRQNIAPHEFSWRCSHLVCVDIGRKVKPAGCFKRWYNFAKMWVRRLRHNDTQACERTAAFTVGKCFRQIYKKT